MLEEPVDPSIVLSHVCPHIAWMHGIDSYSAILEISGKLEHREQLCGFCRAVSLQAGIVVSLPAQIIDSQSGDREAVALGVDIDDPTMALLSQLLLQAVVYDE